MGYRHQVISSINPFFNRELPQWFIEKYEGFINFDDASYWFSHSEYKRGYAYKDLNADIQKALQETSHQSGFPTWVQLVYFADEGEIEHPDIQHVTISAKEITVRMATDWIEQQ